MLIIGKTGKIDQGKIEINNLKQLIAEDTSLLFINCYSGCTILHIFAQRGDSEVVQFLLERCHAVGKKPTEYLNITNMLGQTPLHIATQSANLDVVKLLLEKHTDPLFYINIPDSAENNALHLAISCEHTKITAFFLAILVDLAISKKQWNVVRNFLEDTALKAIQLNLDSELSRIAEGQNITISLDKLARSTYIGYLVRARNGELDPNKALVYATLILGYY